MLPYIVEAINEKLLYIFGACNAITIPIGKHHLTHTIRRHITDLMLVVWALYPESNQRSLEEMDMLFASDSPWVWDAESTFERLRAENADMIVGSDKRKLQDIEEKRNFSTVHDERVNP